MLGHRGKRSVLLDRCRRLPRCPALVRTALARGIVEALRLAGALLRVLRVCLKLEQGVHLIAGRDEHVVVDLYGACRVRKLAREPRDLARRRLAPGRVREYSDTTAYTVSAPDRCGRRNVRTSAATARWMPSAARRRRRWTRAAPSGPHSRSPARSAAPVPDMHNQTHKRQRTTKHSSACRSSLRIRTGLLLRVVGRKRQALHQDKPTRARPSDGCAASKAAAGRMRGIPAY